MRSRGRFFFFHYAGFAVASMIVVGAGTWYPAHMGRTFGWDPSQIGFTLGLTLVVAGVVGKLICGFAVDAMFRRGVHDAQIRWYAGTLAAATPIGVFATTSSDPWVFLGALGIYLALLSPLPACANAALNLVTPNELRGTGVAFFASTAGLVGGGTGPVLIAAVSDHVFGGETTIGLGIAAMIAVCCPLAAVLLACGFRAMREAIGEAERSTFEPTRDSLAPAPRFRFHPRPASSAGAEDPRELGDRRPRYPVRSAAHAPRGRDHRAARRRRGGAGRLGAAPPRPRRRDLRRPARPRGARAGRVQARHLARVSRARGRSCARST